MRIADLETLKFCLEVFQATLILQIQVLKPTTGNSDGKLSFTLLIIEAETNIGSHLQFWLVVGGIFFKKYQLRIGLQVLDFYI